MTPKERATLEHRLAQISAVMPKRCLMGGNEARELIEVQTKIRQVLNPWPVADLDAETAAALSKLDGLPWAQELLAGVK
jgi:hypothetical protein